MWLVRDFQALKVHFDGLPPAADGQDGVSEPQGVRLGPFKKASPKGPLCLVKEVYSLLL